MSFGHTVSNVAFEKVCLGRALFVRVIYAEELDITFRDNLGYKAYTEDLLFYLDLLLFNCTMFFFLSETRLNDPQYYGGGMSFGNTGGNVGQQGTNSGNVAVGHQFNLGYGRRG